MYVEDNNRKNPLLQLKQHRKKTGAKSQINKRPLYES